MIRVLIVAGTRPEIIKLAPVILAARESYADRVSVTLCLTGQHQSMAEEAMGIFGLRPDSGLDIMRPNQTLSHIAQAVFERLPTEVERVRPDVLLVQGDTTTAAAAAWCAFNMRVPVGHVEAGLRTFDMQAPFPEESNRRIISTLATYNFCPTEDARANLLREGASETSLYLTGNTIVDAVRRIRSSHSLSDTGSVHKGIRQPYVLITAHRRESFGGGFENICQAVHLCAKQFPKVQFVYPVHLNPNVQDPVRRLLGGVPNVLLLEPVPYLELLTLMTSCLFILTDSGGIQEEAPTFQKYCIVMRGRTERMESVRLGFSELVGVDRERIVEAVERRMKSPMLQFPQQNPYGDGHAAERILDILAD